MAQVNISNTVFARINGLGVHVSINVARNDVQPVGAEVDSDREVDDAVLAQEIAQELTTELVEYLHDNYAV